MSEKTFKIIGNDLSDGYHTFDELYEHRCLLFCMLLQTAAAQDCIPMGWEMSAWKSHKHEDGSEIEGWFIAGLNLPTGNITYHLPADKWELLGAVLTFERAPKWDGHTSQDVLKRLTNWLVLTNRRGRE